MTNEPTALTAETGPKRQRFRFGLRTLIAGVLVLGLLLGWLSRLQRQILEREDLVATLARERVLVNWREPTLFCLVMTRLRGSRNILPGTPKAFEKWISPGWFSRPVGFNAGKLRDEEVPRVVGRLRTLGDVNEVRYHGGSLDGLRLFYIGRVRDELLGPDRDTCTFKTFPASGAPAIPTAGDRP